MSRGFAQVGYFQKCAMNLRIVAGRLHDSVKVLLYLLPQPARTIASCHIPPQIFTSGHQPGCLKLT